MNNPYTLADLPINQVATVTAITTTGAMRRRLQDLGVIIGTPIKSLQKSPAGDPIAYLIRGTVIALRQEDARGILIQKF